MQVTVRVWFRTSVYGLIHILTDFIERGLPNEDASTLANTKRPVLPRTAGVFLAGENVDNAPSNGAPGIRTPPGRSDALVSVHT